MNRDSIQFGRDEKKENNIENFKLYSEFNLININKKHVFKASYSSNCNLINRGDIKHQRVIWLSMPA